MGKNNRHQKNLKAEKSKVKLKANKSKVLPKGQNVTDINFKVKKIVIKEQLKQHELEEILSRRKLNVKDLLSRLQHYNSTVRQEAIKELKEILLQYPKDVLSSHLNNLLQGIASLTLDKEKPIRQDGVKVLNFILETISAEQLAPFADILISYLCCAMTHIHPSVKEDSLNYLDVIVLHCKELIAKNTCRIFPHFLDMISRHHTQSQTNRQLSITISSRNTSIKWRIKVLERLSNIFSAMIDNKKLHQIQNNSKTQKRIYVDDKTFYIPLYNEYNLEVCRIDFSEDNSNELYGKDYQEAHEFKKYIEILMPLILDSWLEVRPKEKLTGEEAPLISDETANYLNSITTNMQLIIEFVDLIQPLHDEISKNICDKFQNNFVKYFFNHFPYSRSNTIERSKKRQEDFKMSDIDTCLKQNLSLSYIFMWMISVNTLRKFSENTKEICRTILEFITESVNNWKCSNGLNTQLIKLLRLIFIKSSKILHKNNINLDSLLRSVIVASSKQLKKELLEVLGDIIINTHLNHLHNEPSFKEFIMTLPDLLLKEKIYDNTIKIINSVVLRYRNWIKDKLFMKQTEILENAKTIEIIDSNNDKESRLMICNLFHFFNGEIYY
ncbi:testis-expressed protein 10 [Chelonus insularis]|uniref:testis-expressed protein 10 n=1 Tax=Chelonus insularis TaxID=460826 RepID=UPI00158ACEEA|nr:testis-expressed protein 10 [Chelonus insularis]